MFTTLLTAFYLTGGTSLEWARDPLDGYPTRLHMEPRMHAGAGLEFHPSDRLTVDMGVRYQTMALWSDSKDSTVTARVEVRFHPWGNQ